MPSRARLSGRSSRMSRPFQSDLAAGDHVRRVAHQGVGEGRLARAVGAHDRVDLALADRQVDALQDLALGLGDGRDAQAADDEVAGRSAGVRGRSRSWSGLLGWSGRPARGDRPGAAARGRRGSSMSSAPVIASRTRTHRKLTVQRRGPVADRGVLGVLAWRRPSARSGPRGRAGPRSSRIVSGGAASS